MPDPASWASHPSAPGRREVHRVQRKQALQAAAARIRKQKTEYAQGDQGCRVAHPGLLDIFVDAAEPIDQPFERPENRMKERPLAFKHPIHEDARRLGERRARSRRKSRFVRYPVKS